MPSRLIALLFEYASLNGGERSMLAALDWLRKNDASFEFVAIAPSVGRLGDALRERGIAVQDWSPRDDVGERRSADGIESSLRRIVSSLQPQLLHANSLAMGRLSGRLAGRLEIPTSTHLRDIIKLSSRTISELNQNVKLVAVSQATSDFHVAQGIHPHRMTVVRNGIDLDQFQPKPVSGRLQAELNLPDGLSPDRRRAKLVAIIGQIGLRKGQDVMAIASQFIIKKIPEVHFLFIGERTSQKQESIEFARSIDLKFSAMGQTGRLHLLGHRDDVPQLLNEIDLLVHPAHQEPFGRVLLEASAAGVPIVATNVGGTSEIVLDGTTGLLVPPREPQVLADAVIDLLTDNRKADRFRVAARQRAIQEFPISTAAERLADVWRDMLESSAEK